jgi:hypothetical protein
LYFFDYNSSIFGRYVAVYLLKFEVILNGISLSRLITSFFMLWPKERQYNDSNKVFILGLEFIWFICLKIHFIV